MTRTCPIALAAAVLACAQAASYPACHVPHAAGCLLSTAISAPADTVEAQIERVKARAAAFEQMGIDRDRALLLSVILETGDPTILLPLIFGDLSPQQQVMAMMLLSGSRSSRSSAPLALTHDHWLIIVENGTVYKIDLDSMRLTGKVAYRPATPPTLSALPRLLQPLAQNARTREALEKMKQLTLATLMYAQDHDQRLPTKNWVAEIRPYLPNDRVLVDPAWPNVPVGFVLNAAVAGRSLGEFPRPNVVPLFWESRAAAEKPAGGIGSVPAQGPHDGKLVVGFLDGHAALVTPEKLRELLKGAGQ